VLCAGAALSRERPRARLSTVTTTVTMYTADVVPPTPGVSVPDTHCPHAPHIHPPTPQPPRADSNRLILPILPSHFPIAPSHPSMQPSVLLQRNSGRALAAVGLPARARPHRGSSGCTALQCHLQQQRRACTRAVNTQQQDAATTGMAPQPWSGSPEQVQVRQGATRARLALTHRPTANDALSTHHTPHNTHHNTHTTTPHTTHHNTGAAAAAGAHGGCSRGAQ
jgi:hypothetical protein